MGVLSRHRFLCRASRGRLEAECFRRKMHSMRLRVATLLRLMEPDGFKANLQHHAYAINEISLRVEACARTSIF